MFSLLTIMTMAPRLVSLSLRSFSEGTISLLEAKYPFSFYIPSPFLELDAKKTWSRNIASQAEGNQGFWTYDGGFGKTEGRIESGLQTRILKERAK